MRDSGASIGLRNTIAKAIGISFSTSANDCRRKCTLNTESSATPNITMIATNVQDPNGRSNSRSFAVSRTADTAAARQTQASRKTPNSGRTKPSDLEPGTD